MLSVEHDGGSRLEGEKEDATVRTPGKHKSEERGSRKMRTDRSDANPCASSFLLPPSSFLLPRSPLEGDLQPRAEPEVVRDVRLIIERRCLADVESADVVLRHEPKADCARQTEVGASADRSDEVRRVGR